MPEWNSEDLRRITDADELEIAAVRPDGHLRCPRPIWVVRAGEDLYVRAAYGAGSRWHRIAQATGHARISAGGVATEVTVHPIDDRDLLDQIDAAYRSKYGTRYASIVDTITDPDHRATTLRLDPEETAR